MNSIEIAQACKELALEKKMFSPVILDLRELSTIADFFLIASADSEPQLKAVANHLKVELKGKHGVSVLSVDGNTKSHWVVLDYGSVFVHFFTKETRDFYGLEELWKDAPLID